MAERIIREEERVSLRLRSLYQQYGYLPFKMSKFEEYDLYVQNKEFLVGDGVITFNDTDGRLMALKPDVTLSIIKNNVENAIKRKVYYDENVYRISAKTKQFKEIRQVGLECLGDISLYDTYETVCLAAASLQEISENFVLDLSNLGIVSALLEEMGASEPFGKGVMTALANKNAHEMANLCEKYEISKENREKWLLLLGAYGDMEKSLAKIAPICRGKAKSAFEELEALCKLLKNTSYADKIRLDFSVVNDRNYYDDIVFKGFVQGISDGVLSGGRYDKLLSRMGKKSGGIGFAVYLDLLEGFNEQKTEFDVDVLLLYDEKTPVDTVISKVNALLSENKSVRVEKSAGEARYQTLLDLRGGNV